MSQCQNQYFTICSLLSYTIKLGCILPIHITVFSKCQCFESFSVTALYDTKWRHGCVMCQYQHFRCDLTARRSKLLAPYCLNQTFFSYFMALFDSVTMRHDADLCHKCVKCQNQYLTCGLLRHTIKMRCILSYHTMFTKCQCFEAFLSPQQ